MVFSENHMATFIGPYITFYKDNVTSSFIYHWVIFKLNTISAKGQLRAE